MKSDLIRQLTTDFESASHEEEGLEYRLARELQPLLVYKEWRNFAQFIDKAKTVCRNAGLETSDHFVEVNKMVRHYHRVAPAALMGRLFSCLQASRP